MSNVRPKITNCIRLSHSAVASCRVFNWTLLESTKVSFNCKDMTAINQYLLISCQDQACSLTLLCDDFSRIASHIRFIKFHLKCKAHIFSHKYSNQLILWCNLCHVSLSTNFQTHDTGF